MGRTGIARGTNLDKPGVTACFIENASLRLFCRGAHCSSFASNVNSLAMRKASPYTPNRRPFPEWRAPIGTPLLTLTT
jgi:hypothetical protein